MKIITVICCFCDEENTVDISDNDTFVCELCDKPFGVSEKDGSYKTYSI